MILLTNQSDSHRASYMATTFIPLQLPINTEASLPLGSCTQSHPCLHTPPSLLLYELDVVFTESSGRLFSTNPSAPSGTSVSLPSTDPSVAFARALDSLFLVLLQGAFC